MQDENNAHPTKAWLSCLLIVLLSFNGSGCAFLSDSPVERIQKAIEKAAAAKTVKEVATAEAELLAARAEATQVVLEATAETQANATAEARRATEATALARTRGREATAEARAEIRQMTGEGMEKLNEAIEKEDIDEIEDLIDGGVHPPAFRRCLSNYGSPSKMSEIVNLFNNDLITNLPVAWRTGVKMDSAVADYIADRHTWEEATHEICKALLIEATLSR